MSELTRKLRLASRSVTGKFFVLALFFLIVPIILYSRFQAADAERQDFLLRSLQSQGHLAGISLAPRLATLTGKGLLEAEHLLPPLTDNGLGIKLLLLPKGGSQDSFLMIAAQPPITADKMAPERDQLIQTGLLDGLAASCAGGQSLAHPFTGPNGDEMLTSITPLQTTAGCWVILTSYIAHGQDQSALLRPFASAPEVRLATSLYIMMALLLALANLGALFDLRAFTRLAARIRQRQGEKESFAAIAQIPELLPIAREFDRMVTTLDASATALQEAAADTAHALKTPIAAITQSLEPLRPLATTPRAVRAIEVIESALIRLGELVEATRHLDEGSAQLMLARLRPIDIAQLAQTMAAAYDKIHSAKPVRVLYHGRSSALIAGTEDSLETILENLLDNAVDFTPAGGTVRVGVICNEKAAYITVEDEGPGIASDQFDQIFRRDYSRRPQSHTVNQGAGPSHFGLGLAIVQRSVEALGGSITPENRPKGGLKMTVVLPLAR